MEIATAGMNPAQNSSQHFVEISMSLSWAYFDLNKDDNIAVCK